MIEGIKIMFSILQFKRTKNSQLTFITKMNKYVKNIVDKIMLF